MTTTKYELVSDDTIPHPLRGGAHLTRIRALRDIPRHRVTAGDLGGRIESEANLDQSGGAWVSGDARVYGDARVSKTGHVLAIGPVGSENQTFTVWRTKTGHQCAVGCWGPGTLDQLADEVRRRKTSEWAHRSKTDGGVWKTQYKHAITLGQVMADSWAEEAK